MPERRKRDNGFSFPVTTLAGSSLPNFLQLRKDYSIDRRFLGRFLLSIAVSAILEPFRWWEDLRWRDRIKKMRHNQPPVFIIGFWRSGTTMLHEMLCLSPRVSYVTTYQTVFPHQLLSHSWWLKRIAGIFMPSRRPLDNVTMDLDYPQEEEIAMSNIQPLSFYNYLYFPKNYEKFYHRDLFFNNASEKQVTTWKAAYRKLTAKAMINRPGEVFISKNPSNMARIETLIEMFPGARFIFIFRDPYKVIESYYGFFSKVIPAIQLQSSDEDVTRALTVRLYADMLENYYRNKDVIPPQNLLEIRYEDLIQDPLGHLKAIYEKFGLNGYEEDVPRMKAYLEKSRDVAGNHYEISRRTIELVNEHLIERVKWWNYEVKH